MINFTCTNCGHEIKVNDKHAGKKGKCPECKSLAVVPAQSGHARHTSVIKFRCTSCSQKIGVKPEYAGKQVRCAKCHNVLKIPSKSEEDSSQQVQEIKLSRDRKDEGSASDDFIRGPGSLDELLAAEQNAPALSLQKPREPLETSEQAPPDMPLPGTLRFEQDTGPTGRRKLPWPIDVLFYPASTGALFTMGLIVVGTLLSPLFCCFSWVIQILLILYLHWYFCECIRDSADGGTRAPDTVGRQESLGEMLWHFLRLCLCYLIYLYAFAMLYSTYAIVGNTEANEAVRVSLLGFGGFLFPMGILAVSILQSVEGLNPILLIRSIGRTFVQYLALVLLLYGFIIAFHLFVTESALVGLRSGSPGIFLVLAFAIRLAYFWAILVGAHILGRFYWRNEEKLGW